MRNRIGLAVLLLSFAASAQGAQVPFGSQQVISTGADGAASVFAADLDRDGDVDVLSASAGDDTIAWYENRGGQFALATADTAPLLLLEGDTSDLLEVVMTHRGRVGENDEELATLELLFEEAPGDPLSSAEANALIDTLAVYRDTGSGVFEAGSDTLVGSAGTLSLTAGTQTLPLTDHDAGAQVMLGTPGTFFVVVTLTSDANSQTPHEFQVTHVTESSSAAEDRANDIPLRLEYAANVSSRVVLAASLTSDEDGDGLLDTVETETTSTSRRRIRARIPSTGTATTTAPPTAGRWSAGGIPTIRTTLPCPRSRPWAPGARCCCSSCLRRLVPADSGSGAGEVDARGSTRAGGVPNGSGAGSWQHC